MDFLFVLIELLC